MNELIEKLSNGSRYHIGQADFHQFLTQFLNLEEKAIIFALKERGLEDGYMKDFDGDHMPVFKVLLKLLRCVRDSHGNLISDYFEILPEIDQDPFFYQIVTDPMCLSDLEANVNMRTYSTTREFEVDLFKVFDTFRLGSIVGSNRYGLVNILQRYYAGICAPSHLTLNQDFNFASVKAGPGNPYAEELAEGQPGMEGVGPATSRILTRHRTFHDGGFYRGMNLNMGDWVHIINPDDPSKPIPAQLFKVFTPDHLDHPHITVCRYYRPEQTVHASYRRFYETEVFKSGNYVDLPVEDLLEKTFVMFATKYARGRPKEHLWDKRRPLYIVEHRYSPKSKTETGGFSKIKSWNACIPEEVRKTEYDMYHFDEPQRPPLLPSPFLRGLIGPGRIDENAPPPDEIGQHVQTQAAIKLDNLSSLPHLQANQPPTPAQIAYSKKKLQQQAQQQAQAQQSSSLSNLSNIGNQNVDQSTEVHGPQYKRPAQEREEKGKKRKDYNRNITEQFGSKDKIGADGKLEWLPDDTVNNFPKDAINDKLMWFSGPPMNLPKDPTTPYSTKYLLHKLQEQTNSSTSSSNQQLQNDERQSKKVKTDDLNEQIQEALFNELKSFCQSHNISEEQAMNFITNQTKNDNTTAEQGNITEELANQLLYLSESLNKEINEIVQL